LTRQCAAFGIAYLSGSRPTVQNQEQREERVSVPLSELRHLAGHCQGTPTGRLPAQLHEVFSYTFYHGWTQNQIAELLGISERQVRRLWVV
jgi:DNA-directed RNA polymerase specialized sigma24 family protein